MKTQEYREKLAEMFINCLQENGTDWKKQWISSNSEAPYNAASNNSYKGLNRFRLGLEAMDKGYDDPRWATFNQIKKEGWHLKPGSVSTTIEYWFPYDYEKKEAITWTELNEREKNGDKVGLQARYYNVFNAAQIEGIPELPKEEREPVTIHQDELIDTLSRNMGVEILNDGMGRAFYSPSEDKVHLPKKEDFFSDYAYNSTALHELAHATGHPDRLNRDQSGTFGSEKYAYEELVAEMSSCFMSAELSDMEIAEFDLNNHKAYVQNWITAIREKPEYLMKAVKDATNCAEYMDYKAELVPEAEYKKNEACVKEAKVEKVNSLSINNPKAFIWSLENRLGRLEKSEHLRRFGFEGNQYDFEQLEKELVSNFPSREAILGDQTEEGIKNAIHYMEKLDGKWMSDKELDYVIGLTKGEISLFNIKMNGEEKLFKNTSLLNQERLCQAYAACEKPFIDMSQYGERISEVEFAELQQSDKHGFSVEFDADNNRISIFNGNNMEYKNLKETVYVERMNQVITPFFQDAAIKLQAMENMRNPVPDKIWEAVTDINNPDDTTDKDFLIQDALESEENFQGDSRLEDTIINLKGYVDDENLHKTLDRVRDLKHEYNETVSTFRTVTEEYRIQELKKSDIKPTRQILDHYSALDQKIGYHVPLDQMCDWYKNPDSCPENIRESVKEIGDCCRDRQEIAMQIET